MNCGNIALRSALYGLTDPPAGVGLEWLDLQVEKVTALRSPYAHNIEVFQLSCEATADLNCFCYALGIEPDTIRDKRCGWIQPDSYFVESLIDSGLLPQSGEPACPEDIILYLDDEGVPKHAGIMITTGKVRSKWGDGRTHIWDHGIWEVPCNYGSEVRFAKALQTGEAVKAYILWAEQKGL